MAGGKKTHRGVIGGDVNQDLRGASSTHISVAVPHAADQVGLTERHTHSNLNSEVGELLPQPPN